MFLIENVIRSAWRRSEEGPLNVLVIAENNEKYIRLVCQTENNFYLWSSSGNAWKKEIETRPENLHVIDQEWPTSYFDMIICNNRLEQYDLAASLAHKFHLPILLIDHCSSEAVKPTSALETVNISNPQALYKNPSVVVPLSEPVSLSWPSGNLRLVIPPGVDTEKFHIPDKRPMHVSFGEDLTERRIIFDNNTAPQVGEAIFRAFGSKMYTVIPTDSDIKDKEDIYQQGDYFINPQNHLTVKMLDSMSCGNIPICFAKTDLIEFIENGVDGFLVNKIEDIPVLLDNLDRLSTEERSGIGERAREKVISTQLAPKDFASKWKSVFNYMKSQYYTAQV